MFAPFAFCFGFLALILLLFLCDYLNKRHRYNVLSKSKIGGLPALPVLGNALQMRGLTSENMIGYLRKRTGENNKIFRSWVLHQLVIYTADAKDLAALLASPTHITKNNVYDMLSLWLGDGLLLSTGKKWHTRRKIITPTFHFKILEQFVEIFDQQSTIMIERLATEADGKKVVDIFPVVCLMALDVIAETAMGVRVNAQMNPNFSYVKAVKNVTELIAERLRRPAWRFDWLFRLVAPTQYKYLLTNIELMKKFTNNVIQQRRTALQEILETKESKDCDVDMGLGEKKRQALLDVLLQSNIDGKPLSNEDIREEVETFMFEGHDTTTSGISFALYLISRHPAVQRELYAEIVDVLGTDAQQPASLNQLQNLKYMECVIKESLRLFPPVPIIGRYFKEDSELSEYKRTFYFSFQLKNIHLR
nr:cytochrome P450 4d46 [Phortica okadai]